ncbi:3'-5' DNA helicase [Serendipita sp. 411]|nr:3'-5' DNA helicase [Serendipita sp. 411]
MHLQPDRTSMREWIFPLNRAKRDYQYSIVKASLFDNTLVALPTGLGKTFIAGCVMLNFYRWFPEGKIIFVAPTKPLVAQQIEACHETCGIPGTEAIELTGLIPRETRAVHWQTKRVFYMTPQTLVNDLATGISDPKKIILLVVDEAHKGTGDYAYAQIVRFMMATNPFFRLMALTATPGSKPEVVQTIVDSLHISHIEIRNEESMDVRKYMHQKMEKLRALAIQHFAAAEIAEEEKARPGQSAKRPDTKMIVYCTYRECVDEIVEMLNEQRPMIRPHRFIGQGTDKRGTKGVTQKEQIAVINDFKEGKYNVIVATSIGEEGLDIGEVESIVCYDTSKAAIRTVQRAGRTGRKKAGKVEVLLTKGREDSNWEKATDAYKQVQQSIVQGIDLELYGDVPRFLPDGVEPQCLEKTMECIPYEREEAKSRGNSFNSRKTSGKLDSIGTKSSRKRTRLEEPEEDSNENEGPDSSPKRKKRFVQSDSEDEDLKLSKKRKKSNTKKDREGSLLKSSASHTRSAVPSTAFVSARSIAAEDTNDVNHDDAPLEKKPTKRTGS